MRFSLLAASFLLLATVLACVAGDDLGALKKTLNKLCEANKDGAYGSCCGANNNGQSITTLTNIPSCFGTPSTTNSNGIKILFVSKTNPRLLNELEITLP